mmetsp:Transcript_6061/g.9281  ORF Transcript_6061/g.9281 Transcript_6061/m.9281 type:complete len:1018 (-) Transcript_6061:710-3763(-)|eukprot:CAMPEP_0178902858 /NCGR_PEP_ID=MMETSP0786-20121207/4838_1 /TAXON_ID=186022 /ORGANISM="Thalassionema frauenfeldii, Strain CCMP 1798" /LENGTH=1017 /DNA_ID=CAMNT_0020574171 /DNA_START=64 /DNA_END=3117 /DNA_ORIENTATION=-
MYFRGIRFRTVQQKIRQPTRETLFRCSQQSHCRLRTTSSVQAPLSTVAQRDEDEIDEDVQRFATYCMREIWSRHDNFRSPGNEFSNADVWDKPVEELLEDSTSELPKLPESHGVPEEILSKFDPENPPSNLEDLQYWLECESQQESVQKYQNILQAARDRSDYSSLGMVQKLVVEWYQPLRDEIEREQMRYLAGPRRKTMSAYGPYLLCLPAEKMAVILANESILHCCGYQNTGNGVTLGSFANRVGAAIEAELTVQQLLQKRLQEGKKERNVSKDSNDDDDTAEKGNDNVEIETWMYEANHLEQFMEEISKKNKRVRLGTAMYHARRLLENNEEWDTGKKVQVGAALVHILLEKATVKNSNGKRECAFAHNKVYLSEKQVGFVKMHQDVYNLIAKDGHNSTMPISSRQKPMVVPPKKWVNPRKGAYKWLKSKLMRIDGSKLQEEALWGADLSVVCDGLDVIGCIPWIINSKILAVAKQCWDSNIVLGDIPPRNDFEVPPKPTRPDHFPKILDKTSDFYKEHLEEIKEYFYAITKHNRMKQKNMDLISLRASTILKLDQAEKFERFDKIFFPYNLDFRGRAYPIPPHLSTVGSDLCRGLLTFAEAKPLGNRGFYWLKVHLANLAGNDKISFDERASFTDENMENIRAAVDDPFGENRWWMSLEDPFQALATCHEIVQAIDSGNPETYQCSLPVHMDGSCNGLQHYAALGLDLSGGKAVNLCNLEKPQDVYSGVMKEVICRVEEDASKELDFDESTENLSKDDKQALRSNRGAKLVNGLIDRGVVKRTVMTSVYGVTFIGAMNQIKEKIKEKLEDKGLDIDELESEIHSASVYLARVTMDAMGKLNPGARQTMNWLTQCARLIAKEEYPVTWISPIGVPVVQPYRRTKPHNIVTILQTITLADDGDDLPIHKQRQVSAFPPNYVHSLDSSHMLLTALEMDKRGLYFSAVHDSFWTHPCDVDEMNEALRDCFIELYNQPLLEKLKETWELRYASIDFPDLPAKGELDLEEVRSAKYFFQ